MERFDIWLRTCALFAVLAAGCGQSRFEGVASVDKVEPREPVTELDSDASRKALSCEQREVPARWLDGASELILPQNCTRMETGTQQNSLPLLALALDIGPNMQREGWHNTVLSDLRTLCSLAMAERATPELQIITFDDKHVTEDTPILQACSLQTETTIKGLFQLPLKEVSARDVDTVLKDSSLSAGLEAIQKTSRLTTNRKPDALWIATNRAARGQAADVAAAQSSLTALRNAGSRFLSSMPQGRAANLPSSILTASEQLALVASATGVSFEAAAAGFSKLLAEKKSVRYLSCHLVRWQLLNQQGEPLRGRKMLGQTATDGFERIPLQDTQGTRQLKIWRLCEDGLEQQATIRL